MGCLRQRRQAHIHRNSELLQHRQSCVDAGDCLLNMFLQTSPPLWEASPCFARWHNRFSGITGPLHNLQHVPALSPRSRRGAIHRASSSATSGPMRTPRPSASRPTTRGTSDVHDTGTIRRTPSSRSTYTALSPCRCNTPTVSPCQGCTASVIVAVQCHRACFEDDVVWLELLHPLIVAAAQDPKQLSPRPDHHANGFRRSRSPNRRVRRVLERETPECL